MAPVVHLLEAKYQEQMRFVYLDVDERANTTFKRTLGYRFAPHFFVLDPGGNVLDDWYGYSTAEDFEERMLEAIGVVD
jgi:hypothetical protein